MVCMRNYWGRICAPALFALLAASQWSTAKAAPLDVSYIPSDAVAAVIVHPRDLLTAPQASLAPVEVLSAIGKQNVGIDPLDVEQAVLVFAKVRNPPQKPDFGIIVRLTKPYDRRQVLPAVFAQAQSVAAGGKTYWKSASGQLNALHLADDRTLLLATESMMQQMLAATAPAGHLPMLLQRTNIEHHLNVIISVDAMRAEVNQMLAKGPPLTPPFDQFAEAPEHLSAIAMRTSLADQFKFELILLGRDEQGAQELERLANLAIAIGKEAAVNVAAQKVQQGDPEDPVQQAMLKYTQRMADYYAQMLQPKRNGKVVSIAAHSDPGSAGVGAAIALLLPALQSAGGAAQTSNTVNNLKQIGLAIHNHHDTYRFFPTDVTDDQGKPLLSWRVRLLPYLGQGNLFNQFRLDEPWNSEHNLKLLNQMPPVFKNPLIEDPTATNYLAPRGEGTLGEDGKTKIRFADVLDGSSNTIMVVEANAEKAVPWTKPADLDVDLRNPMAGLGDLRPGGFSVLTADGSVRTLTKKITADLLRALFTRAGGEVIPN